MKGLILLFIVISVVSSTKQFEKCSHSIKSMHSNYIHALGNQDLDLVIDEIQKVFQSVPSTFEDCGARREAEVMRAEYPLVCTKLLAREVKLLVKIMRLYAQDREKNEKQIIFYSTMFETIFKTQVSKKCPFLEEHQLMDVKNKGQCAEGAYQLSLTFEQLDMDLMKGSFNTSLTDVGKVIQKMPDTLDSCNQHAIASKIRYNFPDECLGALGSFVRELAALEHNYSHLEWLKKHMKDFTNAFIRVKDACPALTH